MAGTGGGKGWSKARIRKILGPALAGIGLLYTIHSHFNGCPPRVILGAWAIAPPVWLCLEYIFLFDKGDPDDDFESFRHSQGLARNLWLGFLAFLAAFYLGDWS